MNIIEYLEQHNFNPLKDIEDEEGNIVELHELIKKCTNAINKSSVIPDVSERILIAKETVDDIIKDRPYVITEKESVGYYIIDESGEETYYHHSSFYVH